MDMRGNRHGLGVMVAFALGVVVNASSGRAAAPEGRYTFPSIGVVRDERTRLTWQQVTSAQTYTWEGAKAYCASLSLGGSGWRLPTVKELLTLVDDSRDVAPLIDTSAFPETRASTYWTGSVYVGALEAAWRVEFFNGATSGGPVTASSWVRCVL